MGLEVALVFGVWGFASLVVYEIYRMTLPG